jgi:hypothetical protein
MGSATPLKPVAITLQDAWLGLGWNWGEVGILSAVMAACGLAIVYLFRWE